MDGWMKETGGTSSPGGAGPVGDCALGWKSAGIWRKSCSHEKGKKRGRESWSVWRGSRGSG